MQFFVHRNPGRDLLGVRIQPEDVGLLCVHFQPMNEHHDGAHRPYVVNDGCIRCKTMDCVAVCPVDCFYEGENMLVIHPDECIDCGIFAS